MPVTTSKSYPFSDRRECNRAVGAIQADLLFKLSYDFFRFLTICVLSRNLVKDSLIHQCFTEDGPLDTGHRNPQECWRGRRRNPVCTASRPYSLDKSTRGFCRIVAHVLVEFDRGVDQCQDPGEDKNNQLSGIATFKWPGKTENFILRLRTDSPSRLQCSFSSPSMVNSDSCR